jgi:phosphoribosylanthranilate isomerase
MNKRVRVKICGITSLADALAAVEAGADALGFIFHEQSSRYMTVEAAAKIVSHLPPFITKTGVFVDAADSIIRDARSQIPLDVLQFHGSETPERCARFPEPIVKAFRIKDKSSIAALAAYPTSAWLLDSFVENKLGGSGVTFQWELARLAAQYGRPIILAGGLTAENVAEAVRQTNPYAVDVSSGVEAAPGKKDAAKMAAFISAVRSTSE